MKITYNPTKIGAAFPRLDQLHYWQPRVFPRTCLPDVRKRKWTRHEQVVSSSCSGCLLGAPNGGTIAGANGVPDDSVSRPTINSSCCICRLRATSRKCRLLLQVKTYLQAHPLTQTYLRFRPSYNGRSHICISAVHTSVLFSHFHRGDREDACLTDGHSLLGLRSGHFTRCLPQCHKP